MLKPHQLGLAGGLLAAVLFTLCSLAYTLWPETFFQVHSLAYHNFDFSSLEGEGMTWGSYFAGLVYSAVGTYVVLGVFGWLYNQFSK